MGNPFTYIHRGLTTYIYNIKNAPTAQYITRSAALAVIPSTTPQPLPAYHPSNDRPSSSSEWSIDDEVTREKERLKVVGPPAGSIPPTNTKKKSGTFDAVVRAAGSRWALLVTMLLLITWAVMGVVYGPTDIWQVILQDSSSIQCYISATLLMRQQQNATRELLNTIGKMLSRSQGNERMMQLLSDEQLLKLKRSQRSIRRDISSAMQTKEGRFDKMSNTVSRFLGSLTVLAIYWAGILVWVFWGIPLHWSDTWQLYVNTATALELTFTTMFLQNVRQQHEAYLNRCLESIDKVDRDLELNLRLMTGDMGANPVVETTPPPLTRTEKAIDIWAYIVGGSVGVVLSVSVFVAWLAVGDYMEFDDNWWLIIGTYTGLMGFIDGFVLRNVHHRETIMADRQFAKLADQDFQLFYMLDIPFPEDVRGPTKKPLSARVSGGIGRMCEAAGATVASVLIVVALLAVASAMQWTVTGQLICNTPTMIVEGFLLLMLIEGHNSAEAKRREQYTGILERRLMLDRRISAWKDRDYELEVKLLEDESIDMLSISQKYL